jgi:hypothetical protein
MLRTKRGIALIGTAVLALGLTAATPALASDGNSPHHQARPDTSYSIDFIP